jgi:hypothetical protein
MVRNTAILALTAALLAGLLAGCAESEPPATQTPAVANNFPIPDCQTLTAPKNRSYRIATERECLAQPSLDARMNSKACLMQQEIGRCMGSREAQANGYDAAKAMAETAEARRQ